MDLSAYRKEYRHLAVEHRDWPVDVKRFAQFVARGPEPFGAAALMWNRRGQILLIRETSEAGGSAMWATPGGFAEKGETPEQCAARETREETGLVPTITTLTKVIVCHVTNEDRALPYTFFQFEGTAEGTPKPGRGIVMAAWVDGLPHEMHFRYDYLEAWLRGRPSL